MSSEKHILILTPGFPANEQDDTCMPYLQAYLKEASIGNVGLRFTVISLQYPYSKKLYSWSGIPVYPCGGKNRPFPMRFLDWRIAWKFMSKIHTEDRIDVVHSFWLSECTLLAQRWSQLNQVNHVATAMGQDVFSENRYLKHIKLKRLRIAVLSRFQDQQMSANLGRKANQVISFGMQKREGLTNSRNIDVLGVGSLIQLKDYKTFLEVVSKVALEKPSISVTLVGDGLEKENLQDLAQKLGLSNRVQFLGHQPRKMVLELMERSKVLLHTSKSESQGYVFNEAAASGMAIVSRRVGIAEESDRWKIGEEVGELAQHVYNMLDRTFESETLVPIDHTVSQYLKFYGFEVEGQDQG